MADTASLSPQILKQLREEREARRAKSGASAPSVPAPPPRPPPPPQRDDVIEIEESDDEVQLIASPPKRKRADDSDDDVQILPSPSKRPAKLTDDDEVEELDGPPKRSSKADDEVERCKLRCGHVFCVECVKGTVKAAIDDKKLDERLRCPDTSCKAPMTTLDVRACTVDKGDSATWAQYQEVATLASLDLAVSASGGDTGLRRCPAEKCNYTFHWEPHATSGTHFFCPECHGAFCLGCPVVMKMALGGATPGSWHDKDLKKALGDGPKVGPAAHDNPCSVVLADIEHKKELQDKYNKWSIENAQADERFNEMMKKEARKGETKPCPRCKQAITKNSGCDHMSCPCGHQWYWSNGNPYP